MAVLISATFLIVFAWLPYIAGSRGTGVGGDSADPVGKARRSTRAAEANGEVLAKTSMTQRQAEVTAPRLRWPGCGLFSSLTARVSRQLLCNRQAHSRLNLPAAVRWNPHCLKSRQNTKIVAAVFVAGPVFPGIKLYPEAEPHTRLVAPRLYRQPQASARLAPIRSVFLSTAFTGSGAARRIGRHQIRLSCTEVRQRDSSVPPMATECPWKRGRIWDLWSIPNATAPSNSLSKTPTLFRIR